ncbi:MAG: peptidoglycan-binding domain-containing protein [Synechococcus sp.]|nr:peptidoglycan-binding domain-containing protein [Synechococcus sp.]
MFARQTLFSVVLSSLLVGSSSVVLAQTSRPEIRIGSTGTIVSELQTTLRLLGYYSGETTGIYDEATVIAVYQFQKTAKIPETGVMDRTTWNTLLPNSSANLPVADSSPATSSTTSVTQGTSTADANTPTTTTTTPATTSPTTTAAAATTNPNTLPLLKEGMEGDAVKLLQTRLKALGYYDGTIDSVFGPNTRLAVIAAQTAFKLDGDGIVGPQTWSKLLN